MLAVDAIKPGWAVAHQGAVNDFHKVLVSAPILPDVQALAGSAMMRESVRVV